MSAAPESFPAVEIKAIEGYKPSGKVGGLAIPLLLATLLIVPPLLAFIYVKTGHFGGSFFTSAFVLVGTALVLGCVAGAALFPFVHLGKVRNSALATAVGLILGLATFAMAMSIEAHQNYDALMAGQVHKGGPVELSYTEKVTGYWSTVAETGMKVTGRRGSGATASGSMFWGLTGIQALLCVLAAGVIGGLFVGRRFSEEDNLWYTSKTVFKVLPHLLPQVLDVARTGDWAKFKSVAEAAQDPKFNEYKPEVIVHQTPGKSGGILEIKAIPPNEKGGYVKTVFEKHLTEAEIKTLWSQYPGNSGAEVR